MLKAIMPVAIYSIGVLFKKDGFKSETMLNMVSISISVAIAAYGEAKFDTFGVFLQLLAVSFEANRLVLIQILLNAKGILGRNGVDSSAVPRGLAMMQLPFDGSVPVSPLYVPCTGPAPMLALASASPENQRLVMLNEQGLSKGSGFVAFSSPEEATKALHEMIRKMIGWKPLYVAVAQQKE